MSKQKDITSYRFARLTVLSDLDSDIYGNKKWLCICDCGESVSVLGTNLRRNLTRSCGCLQKDIAKTTFTKLKTIHGQSYTNGYKTFAATKYKLDKAKRTPKWANLEKIKKFYINCPDGYEVDHVIPLRGKLVSGFHVESNLQYLTKFQNGSKNNSYEVN